MGILRELLSSRAGRDDDPVAVASVAEVGHRVYVERDPDSVWQHLVSPTRGAELGVDCVRLLPLPGAGPDDLPDFVGVWRRSNGRLSVGLSTVVEVAPRHRIVARSVDGTGARTLTTTIEARDAGCVVTQLVTGSLPADAAAFTRAWLVRSLLGLKADVEGLERTALCDEESDDLVHRVMAAGIVGPGVGTASAPGFTPVSETATVDVSAAPARLWEVLGAPSSEQLLKPGVEHLMRVELADEPGREHVVGVHRHDDGRRGGTVSLVVEAEAPARIVERELTATHESDVVTTIEALGQGSRVSETFTGWLPSGRGRVVDTSAIAAFMRTRLAVVKNLAEGGATPQRDPRTGFLPPGQAADPAPGATEPARGAVERMAAPPTGRRIPVPASVVLPPPHVPDPGEAYDHGPSFFFGEAVFFLAHDAGSP